MPYDSILDRTFLRADGCRVWTGSKDRGYGVAQVLGRRVYVHRFLFEERHGKLKDGNILHHTCMNRACVNDEHLEVTNRAEHQDSGIMINKNKAFCKWGHEFSKSNTYMRIRNYVASSVPVRECRICKDRLRRQYRERRALRINTGILNAV